MDELISGLFVGVFAIVMVAITVIVFVSMWKVFTKAGQPGWTSIVPIYNLVVLLKIVGKPLWWLILLLIPIVSFVTVLIVCVDLAKSFGKGTGFGVGLAFLSIIFFPILGFGHARYQGPSAGVPVRV